MSGSAISSSSGQPLLRLRKKTQRERLHLQLPYALAMPCSSAKACARSSCRAATAAISTFAARSAFSWILCSRSASSSQSSEDKDGASSARWKNTQRALLRGRGEKELHSRQDHRLRRDARRAEDADAQLRHLDRAVPVMRSALSSSSSSLRRSSLRPPRPLRLLEGLLDLSMSPVEVPGPAGYAPATLRFPLRPRSPAIESSAAERLRLEPFGPKSHSSGGWEDTTNRVSRRRLSVTAGRRWTDPADSFRSGWTSKSDGSVQAKRRRAGGHSTETRGAPAERPPPG